MEFKIIKKGVVSSTNDILKLNAKNYESGTVICAKEQTSGRGRTGRSFYSPPTGLYFSILLKDAEKNPAALTIAAAVAVMKGIYEVFGIKTHVKWVNDIFLGGKKICGILTEGAFERGKLRYAVVGIGINISTEKFPKELESIAGSLEKSSEKNDILLEKILKIFSEEIQNFSDGKCIEFYKKNCLTLGRKVRLVSQNISYDEGVVDDIESDGSLVVKCESGETKKVFYGEAEII